MSTGKIDGLATEVRANMERELAQRLKNETKTRVFDALIRANELAVPRSLVDQEIQSLQATRCGRWASTIRARRRLMSVSNHWRSVG